MLLHQIYARFSAIGTNYSKAVDPDHQIDYYRLPVSSWIPHFLTTAAGDPCMRILTS